MAPLNYGIFDSDNHDYEPGDTFRHLDPSMADRAMKIMKPKPEALEAI